MNLGLIFLSLSFASLAGIIYIVSRKIPALLLLTEESLDFKETFSQFANRKAQEVPQTAKNLQISFLKLINKQLLKSKVLSLRVHNISHSWTEYLNRKLNHSNARESDPSFAASEESDKSIEMIATMAASREDEGEEIKQ